MSGERILETADRAIIAATQEGLPLTSRPYAAIGAVAGLGEDEVFARIEAMRAKGVIRRIAAVPNHYALGLAANGMSVWDVEDGAIGRLGAEVGGLDFVTHCYRRPRVPGAWPYNLFAMVHGATRADVMAKVDQIARLLGPASRAHEVLFSTRILKKTGFRLAG
mgnify:FL=1|jgi:DNA-binding Lrp family transcriptional regulator